MLNCAATLEDQIDLVIHRAPHLAGKTLRIETHAGRVVLNGIVGSYYQKQMAQEAVRAVEGVSKVENRLQVCWT